MALGGAVALVRLFSYLRKMQLSHMGEDGQYFDSSGAGEDSRERLFLGQRVRAGVLGSILAIGVWRKRGL